MHIREREIYIYIYHDISLHDILDIPYGDISGYAEIQSADVHMLLAKILLRYAKVLSRYSTLMIIGSAWPRVKHISSSASISYSTVPMASFLKLSRALSSSWSYPATQLPTISRTVSTGLTLGVSVSHSGVSKCVTLRDLVSGAMSVLLFPMLAACKQVRKLLPLLQGNPWH